MCDFVLGYLDVLLPTQIFPSKQDNLNEHKLVLLHTLLLSQTISGSHHLFCAICSVTVNSVYILFFADVLLFVRTVINGFRRLIGE